jgi:hypothetical protein
MKAVRARALLIIVVCAACGSTSAGDLFAPALDGGAGPDAAIDAAADDAGTGDAGSKPDGRARDGAAFDANVRTPLGCSPKSGNTCDLQSQICCRGFSGYACQAPQAQCTGLQIPCAQASDCAARGLPGDVCCGAFDHNNRIYDVSCIPSDQCLLQNMHVVLCNPLSQPGADSCPNEGQCGYSTETLPGFGLCL